MTTKTPSISASLKVYQETSTSWRVGAMRSRSWRLPALLGGEEHSPIWEDRARGYWQRQELKYGYKFGDFTMLAMQDEVLGYPVITTFAVVLERYPGTRVPNLRMQ